MMIFLRRQLLFLLIVMIRFTESERKSRRPKELKQQEEYEIFPLDTLPSDLQVTTYLYKAVPKKFFYWSTVQDGPLSVTIITCSSPIQWFFHFGDKNITDKFGMTEKIVTWDMTTKFFTSTQGGYSLELKALDGDTYVHIYVSTEKGGPQALQSSHFQKLRLIKRQRRRRLTIRWDPSLVDPQGTDYCLAVHNKKSYKSLCAAQIDKFGFATPKTMSSRQPVAASQTVINWQPASDKEVDTIDSKLPIIVCVGKSTQYTLSNLRQGQTYYFSLFAKNRQNNLTYPLGSTWINFDGKVKPISVKDGLSSIANLKRLDGKAVFRYKVPKNHGNQLKIYLIPCGTFIFVEVYLKGKIIGERRNISKFEKLQFDSIMEGDRYYIKVFAANREDIDRSSGIEVYITSKSQSRLPLPVMPSETVVREYQSLRRCDSVTIGWLPSPSKKSVHYCVTVTEGKVRDVDSTQITNQCALDNKITKRADFVLRYCKEVAKSTQNVITEKINYLNPGKSYIIQVTIKKPKGKTLSYDLLQVHTTLSCHW